MIKNCSISTTFRAGLSLSYPWKSQTNKSSPFQVNTWHTSGLTETEAQREPTIKLTLHNTHFENTRNKIFSNDDTWGSMALIYFDQRNIIQLCQRLQWNLGKQTQRLCCIKGKPGKMQEGGVGQEILPNISFSSTRIDNHHITTT